MNQKGSVTVITGAGKGIGKATAILLAEEGMHVVLCGRDPEPLHHTSLLLEQKGTHGLVVSVDVRDWNQVKAMREMTLAKFGRIDVLINNAGVAYYKPVSETTEQEWDDIIDTNMKGIFFCCKAVLPSMQAAQKGVIINISSILGLKAIGNMASYSASKFGVIGFTQSLADEIAKSGIRAYAVCPGPTNTDLHRSIVGKEAAEKAMSPERVANKILAILTGGISVPTGSNVLIDETHPYRYRIPLRNIWEKPLRKLARSLFQGGME